MAEAVTDNSLNLQKPCADEICRDREILKQKEKMLGREGWIASLNFASGITGMFSGPLLGAGLIGLLGVLGAQGGVEPALIVMSIGAAFSFAGMAVNYVQSKSWHDVDFDRMELSAARNAKHLVEELKANNMMIVEHEQNTRADGKKWVQVVKPEQQLPLRT